MIEVTYSAFNIHMGMKVLVKDRLKLSVCLNKDILSCSSICSVHTVHVVVIQIPSQCAAIDYQCFTLYTYPSSYYFLKIQDVWDDVRLQLRRHLLDRLSSRSPEHTGLGHISILSIPERVHCLQQLFFLYPECEVLTHYQVQYNSVNAMMRNSFLHE